MALNLLLTNIPENYSFEKSKGFLIPRITEMLPSSVNEVIFILNAYNGDDLEMYKRNVTDLFGNTRLKFILAGTDTIPLIDNAEAIAIGGGDMSLLENTIDPAVRTAIRNSTNRRIPFLTWNEGSVFASPAKIEGLSTQTDDFLRIVPFQFVSHYNDNNQNRISIRDFLVNNSTIKHAVCFCDEPMTEETARSTTVVSGVYGASPEKTEGTDDKGSGVRIEEENVGLAGTEANATLKLFHVENGELVEDPPANIGNII